jgi:DNA uptake protein ComE-like DNA-binding protein
MAQRPPYKPRSAAFQTVREMLMVRGITPDLLLAKDVHQNGLLEDLSDGANEPPKYRDTVSEDDLGWAGILTVDSAAKNVNAAGDDRVNIQTADETSLTTVKGITRDIARAMVAYRNQNRFQGIADLLDVTPPRNNGNVPNARNNSTPPPGGSDSSGQRVIDENLFMEIADDVTTADDKTLSGAININTAGANVLICLPGIDRDLAKKIISHRQSSGFFANPAELLKVDGMTRDIFKQVAPLVTARSETFRILAEGRVKSTGVRQRVQVIARVNLDGVKTASLHRNQSRFAAGFARKRRPRAAATARDGREIDRRVPEGIDFRLAEFSGAKKLATARAGDLRHQRARGFAPKNCAAGGGGRRTRKRAAAADRKGISAVAGRTGLGLARNLQRPRPARSHRRRRSQGSHRGLRRHLVGGGRKS